MKYGKIAHVLLSGAVAMTLSSCAYDPGYRPLAAHQAYYYGGPYREEVVVVDHGRGPGPHRYYDHHYYGWDDRDWGDRY